MRIVADESVDGRLVAALERDGRRIWAVSRHCPGIEDVEVAARAREMGALLITADKDFGDLAFKGGIAVGGILLLRLEDVPVADMISRVRQTLAQNGDALCGCFSVLSSRALRMTRLKDIAR